MDERMRFVARLMEGFTELRLVKSDSVTNGEAEGHAQVSTPRAEGSTKRGRHAIGLMSRKEAAVGSISINNCPLTRLV